jgi:phosphatidylserine/phosphatidylglycerophosphate/cardiolipin synthase-like enzyme
MKRFCLLAAAALVLSVLPTPLAVGRVSGKPHHDGPSSFAAQQSQSLVISALHYFGYDGNSDEAVQLANISPGSIMLDSDWTLTDEGNRSLAFPALTIPAGGRIWVANNAASFSHQFGFSPTLSYAQMAGTPLVFANDGGSARLQRVAPETLDTANASGGGWDAGTGSPDYRSMERIDAGALDTPSNWADANPIVPIAIDAGGNPITGTPRAANSVAVAPTLPTTQTVVINEVAWGGTKANAAHEWIELYNNLTSSVVLTGSQISIVGKDVIPLSGVIAGNGYFLIQRNASTFTSGAVADLTDSFSLSNSGETLQLIDAHAEVVDTLVYGDGKPQSGWISAPLQPYTVTQTIPDDGQVLMRRLNPASGLPIIDTDAAQDWFSHRGDALDMRTPIYPGWDIESFFAPTNGNGTLTLAIAPDNSFDVVSHTLASATTSIDIESFTFEQARLAELLAAKAAASVTVRILLDGAPVGGLTDQTRWICQLISSANPNSGCWFMRSDSSAKVHTRYAYLHAKFAIVDDQRLIAGSENFGSRGMPDDDKSDGTTGQRGVIAVVDAAPLVARARAIFDADIDSAHRDITRWCSACTPYGPPPIEFTPNYASGGISYTVPFSPLQISSPTSMTMFTSPENHLHSANSIVTLVNAAGVGDEILVEQLDEPHYWGPTTSNPTVDPNPRLQAIIGAASRGASVRVLLDRYYDDPAAARSNFATVRYLSILAQANGWDLRASIGNPTGLGIHNKMFLVRLGNRRFAHVGSWNGTEVSAKRDREVSLLIESDLAHEFLREMFQRDFQAAQPVYLPLAMSAFKPIDYPLISEVLFNPLGGDETGREWIELYNPTPFPIDLTGHKIGDAATPSSSSGDGMYQFPAGATLLPYDAVVIAQNANAFLTDWGFKPDYELGNYDPAVPDLTPYSAWSNGIVTLANAGDELVLLGTSDTILDAVTWLSGTVEGTQPFTGIVASGHTLQRWPPETDSNNCALDFRDQAVPSPGKIP